MRSRRLARAAVVAAATGVAAVAVIGAPAANAADVCPNAKYRTGPSLKLPDCRAYELVTPPQKVNEITVWNGGLSPARVSADGDKILYLTATGPVAQQSAFGGIPTWEIGTRDEDGGWAVKPAMAAPHGPYIDPVTGVPNWMIATPELDRFFFYASLIYDPVSQPFSATGDSRMNGGAFLADESSGTWVSRPTSAVAAPVQGGANTPGYWFVPLGGSTDLSTVYFASPGTLTVADETSGRPPIQSWATYKYKDGQLTNAGVLPDGSISRGGSIGAAHEGTTNFPGGSLPGATLTDRSRYNPVSKDGRSFLFVSPDPRRVAVDATLPKPQLYMAVEGEETVLLSAPEGESEPAPGSGGVKSVARDSGVGSTPGYAIATPDHSVVLFATADALTEEAEAAAPGVVKTYRYEEGSLTYLPELDGEGYPIELSESGDSMLYATAGNELKLWRADEPTPRLISNGVEARQLSHARFSKDESVLLMNSAPALRGEPDHAGPYTTGSATPATHVYRYEVATDELDCVSCREGTPLPGRATFTQWGHANAGFSSSTTLRAYWTNRGMSEDGSRVFFTSSSALVPEDRNTVNDVYQWHDGQLSLISSGSAASRGQRLYDTNADGSTVFISSDDRLVPADRDEYYDVYAVRINGGFDPPQPPSSDSGCVGDSCQGSAAPSPALPEVGSVAFGGDGNVPAGPPKATVRVSRLGAVTGSAARVRVRIPAAGRISVTGSSIRRSGRPATKAGTYSVRIVLSAKARKALKQRKKLRVTVRVAFRAKDGRSASKTIAVTFKQPKAKRSVSTRKGR